jgi:hypothetical protein
MPHLAPITRYSLVVQSDFKTIIGGNFGSYNASHRDMVRPDESGWIADTTFNPGDGAVKTRSSVVHFVGGF